LSLENYFHFFLFLVFKFLITYFYFFTLAKVTFISWLFLLFYVYIFLQHFPALAFYLPLLLLPRMIYINFLIFGLFFITRCFDLLPWFSLYFTSLLGWFCTYCFWPLPWFSYFTFSISWLFVSGLLPWFSLHFFLGRILYLLFFTFTLIFLLYFFNFLCLFCSHCFCLFPWFFNFYFLNFWVVWQVAFTVLKFYHDYLLLIRKFQCIL
jgi:hypothetical protein